MVLDQQQSHQHKLAKIFFNMTCKGKQGTVAIKKIRIFFHDQEFIFILGASWPRCTNLFPHFSEIVTTF